MAANIQATALTFVTQLAEDLEDKRLELPAFPDAVIRVQLALQSDDNSVADIVQILSSEPALAARLLQLANTAQIRRADSEISDLHKAVSRMGYAMVRSIAISFAMRQMARNDGYSATAKAELKTAWTEATQIAPVCYVLAKHHTRTNPDEALLTGLLHVIGRLYIVMRFESMDAVSAEDLAAVVGDWHTSIGKAIAESWGLPDALALAIEQQNDYDVKFTGPISLSEVLIAAKLINNGQPSDACSDPSAEGSEPLPVLERLGMVQADASETMGMSPYIEEIERVRATLAG